MWKCLPSSTTIGPRDLSSSYNQFNGVPPNDIQRQLPRFKLTGSGKMPVMDMRSNNIMQNYANVPQSLNYPDQTPYNQVQLNPTIKDPVAQGINKSHLAGGIHPPVVGLPPKSPVYAVVNKANKRQIEKTSNTNNMSSTTSPIKGEVEKYDFVTIS